MINFAELATALGPTPDYTAAEKEAVAKQLGFKNATEMLAFEKQKQTKREVTVVRKTAGPTQEPKKGVAPPPQRGLFQVIQDALAGKVY
jgi:hypothetical protein